MCFQQHQVVSISSLTSRLSHTPSLFVAPVPLLLQECDCWQSIAQVRESAGQSVEEVMKVYRRAANLAEKAAAQPKKRVRKRIQ